jgi:hypothetical protein
MADELQNLPERAQLKIEHIDLPDLAETFADSIEAVHFDGQLLRITFGVTRLDPQTQGAPASARRYPAVRLVLPSGAGVELMNHMEKPKAGLIQAGIPRTPPRGRKLRPSPRGARGRRRPGSGGSWP